MISIFFGRKISAYWLLIVSLVCAVWLIREKIRDSLNNEIRMIEWFIFQAIKKWFSLMEKDGIEFFQASIIKAVNMKTLDPALYEQLEGYCTQISESLCLSPPNQDKTDQFLDDFAPRLINVILSNQVIESQYGSLCQTALQAFAKLGSILIGSEHTEFLVSIYKMLSLSSSAYYISTVTKNIWTGEVSSPLIFQNIATFSKDPTIKKFKDFFQQENCTNLKNFQVILYLLNTSQGQFSKGKYQECVSEACKHIIEMCKKVEGKALRDFDEKIVDSIIDLLIKMSNSQKEINQEILEMKVLLAIKCAKSKYLQKRFHGLAVLRHLIEMKNKNDPNALSYKTICALINEAGLIQLLLSDLHNQLVNDFVVIFIEMIINNFVGKEQVIQFWNLTLNQHGTVINAFFSAWNRMIMSIPQIHVHLVYDAIMTTSVFPPEIFPFLRTISMKCNNEQKIQIFNFIFKYATSQELQEKVQSDVINALTAYIPFDEEFCSELQQKTISMIENDHNKLIALNVLMASCKYSINKHKAHSYFNIVLNSLQPENSFQFLGFLQKLLHQMTDSLTSEEFSKLIYFTMPFIDDYVTCSFFYDILGQHVLTREMKVAIFNELCSQEKMNSQIFGLISTLYGIIKSRSYLDKIWDLLFRTSEPRMISFMINQVSDNREFIDKCMENITNIGALKAIEALIHAKEDGIDKEMLNIPSNKFIPDDKKVTINLVGDVTMSILVPRHLSVRNLTYRVSSMMQHEKEKISFQEMPQYLYDGMTLTVVSTYSVYHSMDTDVNTIPTQILLDEKYKSQLIDLFLNGEKEKALIAFKILNEMTTIPSLFDENEIIGTDSKLLFRYKLNAIGNKIVANQTEWIKNFILSGNIKSLFSYILESKNTENENEVCLLLMITEMLITYESLCNEIDFVIHELPDSTIDEFTNCILKDFKNPRILHYFLLILKHLINVKPSNLPYFNADIFRSTLFNSDQSVQNDMAEVLMCLDPREYQQMILELLPEALHQNSQSYFKLLSVISQNTDEPEKLLDSIIDAVYKSFIPDIKLPLYEQLMFKQPHPAFVAQIFSIISKTLDRVESFINTSNLYTFLINNVLFNSTKYFEVSNEFVELLKKLISKEPELINSMKPKLEAAVDTIDIVPDSNTQLTFSNPYKGLKNYGATCYMNSIIQQVFSIQEFRNRILSTNFSSNDWMPEFQYLMAQLTFYQADYIEPEYFIKKWTDWDGKEINPHQQQDAVEFLQMLFDRLEDVLKDNNMFQGEFNHEIRGVDTDFQTTMIEPFLTLPLEVKAHVNVGESFKTFLIPDHFDEYNADGYGKISVDRINRIKKAPPVLIIQLKRFEFNLSTGEREKVNSRYIFPMQLDLAPLMLDPSVECQYDLTGVVVHMGSCQSGHYYSYILKEDSNWYQFNDTSVNKSNKESIISMTCGGSETQGNAYLLFYKQRDFHFEDSHSDIDQSVLKRTISEISSFLLKYTLSSINMARLSTQVMDDPKFFINYIHKVANETVFNIISTKLQALSKEDATNADLILDNSEIHFQIILDQSTLNISRLYTDLLCYAMGYATSDKLDTFIDSFFSRVKNDSNVLILYYNRFSIFFKPFIKYLEVKKDLSSIANNWLEVFTSFIGQSLIEFDNSNPNINIFDCIDLSIIFNIINKLVFETNPPKALLKNIFSQEFMLKCFNSKYNTIGYSRLLIALKKERKIIQIMTDGASPTLAAHCFICLICVNPEKIDKVLSIIEKQNESFMPQFLEQVANVGISFLDIFGDVFFGHCNDWIDKWLMSDDPIIRISSLDIFFTFLPEFGREATNKCEGDTTRIHSLYKSLLYKLGDLTQICEKLYKDFQFNRITADGFIDQCPAQQYMILFKWSIIAGGFNDEFAKAGKTIGDSLNKLGQLKYLPMNVPRIALVDVIFSVIDESNCGEFFEKASTATILRGLDSLTYNETQYVSTPYVITRLIHFLPESEIKIFSESKIFERVLQYCFKPSSQLGPELRVFISHNLHLMDANRIAKAIWGGNFLTMINNGSIEILKLSWKLLKKEPKTANILEESKNLSPLWFVAYRRLKSITRLMQSDNQFLCILKMLGIFNHSYLDINKGKSSFWSGSYEKWLVNFWAQKQLSLDIFVRITTYTNSVQGAGKDGNFIFLTSLLLLNQFTKEIWIAVLPLTEHGYLAKISKSVQPDATAFFIALVKSANRQKIITEKEIAKYVFEEFRYLLEQSNLLPLTPFKLLFESSIDMIHVYHNQKCIKDLVPSLTKVLSHTEEIEIYDMKMGIAILVSHLIQYGVAFDTNNWVNNVIKLIKKSLKKYIKYGNDQKDKIIIGVDFLLMINRITSCNVPIIYLPMNDYSIIVDLFKDDEVVASQVVKYIKPDEST